MAPASRKCFDRPFPLFVTRRDLTIDSTSEQLLSPCVMITAHFPRQTWSLHQGVLRKGHAQCWGSALEPLSYTMGGDIALKTHANPLGTRFRKAICFCCSSDLLLEPTQNWERSYQNKAKPKAVLDPIACQSRSNWQTSAPNMCPVLCSTLAIEGKLIFFSALSQCQAE